MGVHREIKYEILLFLTMIACLLSPIVIMKVLLS